MKIKKFIFNAFYENTYIVWDDISKEGIVIDPGCYAPGEKKELKNFIEENKIIPKYLVNTHCHLDHIFGNKFILEKYECQFLIPKNEEILLKNFSTQAVSFGFDVYEQPTNYKFLDDNNSLEIGDYKFELIFTPGHSPGGFCLYSISEKICFTGDVLFKDSIGRTDLFGGSFEQMISSIKSKLLILDDEVKIFPGHGEESSIGYERNYNPFLK